MPRKKRPAAAVTNEHASSPESNPPARAETIATVADAERVSDSPATERPAWIDGPPAFVAADEPAGTASAKNWGPPYKAIFASRDQGFEMGEDRRFKQRVFKFVDKPSDDVLARLKDEGFTYRANEKSWTIPANPDTRQLSDELARQFAGQAAGMAR